MNRTILLQNHNLHYIKPLYADLSALFRHSDSVVSDDVKKEYISKFVDLLYFLLQNNKFIGISDEESWERLYGEKSSSEEKEIPIIVVEGLPGIFSYTYQPLSQAIRLITTPSPTSTRLLLHSMPRWTILEIISACMLTLVMSTSSLYFESDPIIDILQSNLLFLSHFVMELSRNSFPTQDRIRIDNCISMSLLTLETVLLKLGAVFPRQSYKELFNLLNVHTIAPASSQLLPESTLVHAHRFEFFIVARRILDFHDVHVPVFLLEPELSSRIFSLSSRGSSPSSFQKDMISSLFQSHSTDSSVSRGGSGSLFNPLKNAFLTLSRGASVHRLQALRALTVLCVVVGWPSIESSGESVESTQNLYDLPGFFHFYHVFPTLVASLLKDLTSMESGMTPLSRMLWVRDETEISEQDRPNFLLRLQLSRSLRVLLSLAGLPQRWQGPAENSEFYKQLKVLKLRSISTISSWLMRLFFQNRESEEGDIVVAASADLQDASNSSESSDCSTVFSMYSFVQLPVWSSLAEELIALLGCITHPATPKLSPSSASQRRSDSFDDDGSRMDMSANIFFDFHSDVDAFVTAVEAIQVVALLLVHRGGVSEKHGVHDNPLSSSSSMAWLLDFVKKYPDVLLLPFISSFLPAIPNHAEKSNLPSISFANSELLLSDTHLWVVTLLTRLFPTRLDALPRLLPLILKFLPDPPTIYGEALGFIVPEGQSKSHLYANRMIMNNMIQQATFLLLVLRSKSVDSDGISLWMKRIFRFFAIYSDDSGGSEESKGLLVLLEYVISSFAFDESNFTTTDGSSLDNYDYFGTSRRSPLELLLFSLMGLYHHSATGPITEGNSRLENTKKLSVELPLLLMNQLTHLSSLFVASDADTQPPSIQSNYLHNNNSFWKRRRSFLYLGKVFLTFLVCNIVYLSRESLLRRLRVKGPSNSLSSALDTLKKGSSLSLLEMADFSTFPLTLDVLSEISERNLPALGADLTAAARKLVDAAVFVLENPGVPTSSSYFMSMASASRLLLCCCALSELALRAFSPLATGALAKACTTLAAIESPESTSTQRFLIFSLDLVGRLHKMFDSKKELMTPVWTRFLTFPAPTVVRRSLEVSSSLFSVNPNNVFPPSADGTFSTFENGRSRGDLDNDIAEDDPEAAFVQKYNKKKQTSLPTATNNTIENSLSENQLHSSNLSLVQLPLNPQPLASSSGVLARAALVQSSSAVVAKATVDMQSVAAPLSVTGSSTDSHRRDPRARMAALASNAGILVVTMQAKVEEIRKNPTLFFLDEEGNQESPNEFRPAAALSEALDATEALIQARSSLFINDFAELASMESVDFDKFISSPFLQDTHEGSTSSMLVDKSDPSTNKQQLSTTQRNYMMMRSQNLLGFRRSRELITTLTQTAIVQGLHASTALAIESDPGSYRPRPLVDTISSAFSHSARFSNNARSLMLRLLNSSPMSPPILIESAATPNTPIPRAKCFCMTLDGSRRCKYSVHSNLNGVCEHPQWNLLHAIPTLRARTREQIAQSAMAMLDTVNSAFSSTQSSIALLDTWIHSSDKYSILHTLEASFALCLASIRGVHAAAAALSRHNDLLMPLLVQAWPHVLGCVSLQTVLKSSSSLISRDSSSDGNSHFTLTSTVSAKELIRLWDSDGRLSNQQQSLSLSDDNPAHNQMVAVGMNSNEFALALQKSSEIVEDAERTEALSTVLSQALAIPSPHINKFKSSTKGNEQLCTLLSDFSSANTPESMSLSLFSSTDARVPPAAAKSATALSVLFMRRRADAINKYNIDVTRSGAVVESAVSGMTTAPIDKQLTSHRHSMAIPLIEPLSRNEKMESAIVGMRGYSPPVNKDIRSYFSRPANALSGPSKSSELVSGQDLVTSDGQDVVVVESATVENSNSSSFEWSNKSISQFSMHLSIVALEFLTSCVSGSEVIVPSNESMSGMNHSTSTAVVVFRGLYSATFMRARAEQDLYPLIRTILLRMLVDLQNDASISRIHSLPLYVTALRCLFLLLRPCPEFREPLPSASVAVRESAESESALEEHSAEDSRLVRDQERKEQEEGANLNDVILIPAPLSALSKEIAMILVTLLRFQDNLRSEKWSIRMPWFLQLYQLSDSSSRKENELTLGDHANAGELLKACVSVLRNCDAPALSVASLLK